MTTEDHDYLAACADVLLEASTYAPIPIRGASLTHQQCAKAHEVLKKHLKDLTEPKTKAPAKKRKETPKA